MRLPTPLLRRNKRAHKNEFGHLLVVAGSPSMLGAACLVALAAMRSGAGLVTGAIPKALNNTLQRKIAHAIMTLPVTGAAGEVFGKKDIGVLKKCWHKYTAVAVGPGLGLKPATIQFVRTIIEQCPLPMVIDADAINALSGGLKPLKKSPGPRVLTPHPGEFFRLTGLKPETDRERRLAARSFAIKHNVVLVLKGRHSIVASADGRVYLNKTGNAGMAKAGMGDVLTGMIGALLAQGVPAFEAARAAVHWHGAAGDLCLKNKHIFSLTAPDLIEILASKKLTSILHAEF